MYLYMYSLQDYSSTTITLILSFNKFLIQIVIFEITHLNFDLKTLFYCFKSSALQIYVKTNPFENSIMI